MAIDIEDLFYGDEWEKLKEKYLIDGDISDIAAYVREHGVTSEQQKNDIANILTGELKRKKQPVEPMKFAGKALKAQADELEYKILNKALEFEIKHGFVQPFKPMLSDENIRKMIAYRYSNGDREYARQVLHRAKKKIKKQA